MDQGETSQAAIGRRVANCLGNWNRHGRGGRGACRRGGWVWDDESHPNGHAVRADIRICRPQFLLRNLEFFGDLTDRIACLNDVKKGCGSWQGCFEDDKNIGCGAGRRGCGLVGLGWSV